MSAHPETDARFAPRAVNVSVTISGVGGLVEGGGRVEAGQRMTVRAIPEAGYEFDCWRVSDGMVHTQPVLVVVATSDLTLTAFFRRPSVVIEASAFPLKGGIVAGSGHYAPGRLVSLLALPAATHVFVGWQGLPSWQCETLAQFPAERSLHVRARFKLIGELKELRVTMKPAGAGTVAGGGTYPLGKLAEISATPLPGYVFSHWQGGEAAEPGASHTRIIIAEDISLKAVFAIHRVTVTPEARPLGSGHVTGAGRYKEGRRITVAARAKPGWRFVCWEGPVESPYRPRTLVTCREGMTLAAVFTPAGH